MVKILETKLNASYDEWLGSAYISAKKCTENNKKDHKQKISHISIHFCHKIIF